MKYLSVSEQHNQSNVTFGSADPDNLNAVAASLLMFKTDMLAQAKKTSQSPHKHSYITELEHYVWEVTIILAAVMDHSDHLKRKDDPLTDYNFMLNITDDWLFVVDKTLIVLMANVAFEQAVGKTQSDIIGKRLDRIITNRFLVQEFLSAIKQALKGEVQLISIANAELDVSLSVKVSPDRLDNNQINQVGIVVQDMTSKRKIETKLRERSKYLDHVHDAVFVMNMDQAIVYQNQSARDLLGWHDDALDLSKHLSKCLVNIDLFHHAFSTVFSEGTWSGEMAFIAHNGDIMTVKSRWTLLDEGLNQLGVLVTNQDISSEKETETQLFRAQRLESIGALAGGIAHDLNNVLSLFSLALKALEPHIQAQPQAEKLVELMTTNSERGVHLVRQILTFVRGVEDEHVSFQLQDIIRELGTILNETFPKTIDCEYVIANDLLPVRGNATQVQQVLLNICVNARDAVMDTSRKGSIFITANYIARHQATGKGPFNCISIKDDGPGIPADLQRTIFDPFFTTKEVGKGTGIGLSTAQSIIHNHNGFIEVKSKIGEGSAFYIYLPVHSDIK